MIQCTYCGKEIDSTIGECYCDKTQWEQSQEPRHVDALVMWRAVEDELPDKDGDYLIAFDIDAYGNSIFERYTDVAEFKTVRCADGTVNKVWREVNTKELISATTANGEFKVCYWAELPKPPRAT